MVQEFVTRFLVCRYGNNNKFNDYLTYLCRKSCISRNMFTLIVTGLHSRIMRNRKRNIPTTEKEIIKEFISYNFIYCLDTYCPYKTFFSKCKQPKRFIEFEKSWINSSVRVPKKVTILRPKSTVYTVTIVNSPNTTVIFPWKFWKNLKSSNVPLEERTSGSSGIGELYC